MKHTSSKESGQALVLILLATVAIIGFSALAVDGGMLYAERRRAQNAADTAAFAAAMAGLQKETESNIVSAGMAQANLNGFDSSEENDVVVNHPPVSGPYAGNKNYYQVIIRTEFKPYFSQFVYSGTLENTVEAVAKGVPSDTLSPGNAIFATGPNKCHAIWFAGSANMSITDGHVFSSSKRSSDTNCASGKNQGSADLVMKGGSIRTVGGFYNGGTIKYQPGQNVTGTGKLETGVAEETLPVLDPPSCAMYGASQTYSWDKKWGDVTLNPGIYDEFDIKGNVTLKRGIYCIDGDLKINAGSSLDGEAGVLLYMRGSSGDPSSILVNGGANVKLRAATGTPLLDANNYDWSGMLVYMDYANEGVVSMNGNAGSQFSGTIYAPGPTVNEKESDKTSKCEIQGSAENISYRTQIICYSINFTGSAMVDVTYRQEEQHHVKPHVELAQ